ncbi:MAG: hypothetical protein NC085_02965 [Muribaculaceae bacterium]|nr:hypothetical protein [Muribaculaceae bacterium]
MKTVRRTVFKGQSAINCYKGDALYRRASPSFGSRRNSPPAELLNDRGVSPPAGGDEGAAPRPCSLERLANFLLA